jgi:hypothetical protein
VDDEPGGRPEETNMGDEIELVLARISSRYKLLHQNLEDNAHTLRALRAERNELSAQVARLEGELATRTEERDRAEQQVRATQAAIFEMRKDALAGGVGSGGAGVGDAGGAHEAQAVTTAEEADRRWGKGFGDVFRGTFAAPRGERPGARAEIRLSADGKVWGEPGEKLKIQSGGSVWACVADMRGVYSVGWTFDRPHAADPAPSSGILSGPCGSIVQFQPPVGDGWGLIRVTVNNGRDEFGVEWPMQLSATAKWYVAEEKPAGDLPKPDEELPRLSLRYHGSADVLEAFRDWRDALNFYESWDYHQRLDLDDAQGRTIQRIRVEAFNVLIARINDAKRMHEEKPR